MKTKIYKMIVFLLIAAPIMAYAGHPIEKIIEKYRGQDGFKVVLINQDMFDAISELSDEEDQGQIKKAASSMKGIKIITYEPDNPDPKKIKAFYDEVVNSIDMSKYKELMVVEEDDESVRILVRKDGDNYKEMLIITQEEDEASVIYISGHMNLKDLSKLSKTQNFEDLMKMKQEKKKAKKMKQKRMEKNSKGE